MGIYSELRTRPGDFATSLRETESPRRTTHAERERDAALVKRELCKADSVRCRLGLGGRWKARSTENKTAFLPNKSDLQTRSARSSRLAARTDGGVRREGSPRRPGKSDAVTGRRACKMGGCYRLGVVPPIFRRLDVLEVSP